MLYLQSGKIGIRLISKGEARMNLLKVIVFSDDEKTYQDIVHAMDLHEEIIVSDRVTSLPELFHTINDIVPQLLFLDTDTISSQNLQTLGMFVNAVSKETKIVEVSSNEHVVRINFSNCVLTSIQKPISVQKIIVAIKEYHIYATQLEYEKKFQAGKDITEVNNFIIVPTVTGYKNINKDDIFYIRKEKDSERIEIFYDQQTSCSVVGGCTLKQLETKLCHSVFYRIDRNTIINLNYLNEIETKTRLCKLCKKESVQNLTISRSRLKEFRELYKMPEM